MIDGHKSQDLRQRALACIEDASKFCNNCILSAISNEKELSNSEIDYFDKEKRIIKFKDGNIFFGTMQDLENNKQLKAGWIYAENLFAKYFLK